MVVELLVFGIAFVALIIGTITDLKVREVPDWLNYGLIVAGFGLRIIFSIVYADPSHIISGIIGFTAFFLVSVLMFYTGQWGGGDSKMMMGLGAIIGLELSLSAFLVGFLVNMVLFGALFGILFSVYLVIMNFKSFCKEFKKKFNRKEQYVLWGACAALIILSLFVQFEVKIPLVVLAFMLLLTYYMFKYLKAVEGAAMLKWVNPSDLTEGDWVVDDVVVAGKRICGPKDLGLEKEQIAKLQDLSRKGKLNKVLIKYGIPFVPSFLIAFIVTYVWGNVVFMIMGV
ncbi:prepilin peptidase [Candidatus Woesearchaeota archaeon]|nr:prepilin peptidase [Candidatus Woesearchaeota archaeon]